MAWVWISVCFLAVLSSEVVTGDRQTPSWTSGNLQGKMFSMTIRGNVYFSSNDQTSNFTGLTLCLRVMTDQTDYSTKLSFINQTAGVRLEVYNGYYNLYVNEDSVSFNMLGMAPAYEERWPWKNRCLTWESSSGMAQLWSDGNMSARKGLARGQVFPFLDELSFDQFAGQVSDVFVWNRALTSRDLVKFFYYINKVAPGSVLDWRQIQYRTSGYTVLEPIFTQPYSVKADRRKKQKNSEGLRRRVHKERLKKKIKLQ